MHLFFLISYYHQMISLDVASLSQVVDCMWPLSLWLGAQDNSSTCSCTGGIMSVFCPVTLTYVTDL
jgi:hypothetical protein